MTCILCQDGCSSYDDRQHAVTCVECPNCGRYKIDGLALRSLGDDKQEIFDIASWVYEQNVSGTVPFIRSQDIEEIKNFPKPNTQKRIERYLGRVIKLLNNNLVGRFDPTNTALRVASWSLRKEDAIAIADYLKTLGAVELISDHLNQYRLVAKAHILYEEMTASRANSSQVFVAMWFHDSMTDAFNNGFDVAIRNAGYDTLRIDRKEHDRKVDDEIIAEIRHSAFVVADFTGQRGGVYYEAGFAHGLGKRVIFTCHKREKEEELHFDVRQYNTIFWEKTDDLIAPLQNRILALFGAGPLKPNAKPIPL
jgi:hypothetical protein